MNEPADNKENDEIVEEIVEDIMNVELVDKKEGSSSGSLTISKDRVVVDEIDMFSDNNYWNVDANLNNNALLDDILNDFKN